MRRIATAAALLSLALFVAACGSDKQAESQSAPPPVVKTADKSAEEILRDTQAAFRAANSVRVKGKVVQGGTPIELDMRIARDTGARGSIVNNGVKISLIRSGQQLWLRGEQFWRQALPKNVADRIGDRWVQVPASAAAGAGASIDAFTDLDGILDQVLTPNGTLTKGATKTINGVPAIGLDDGGSGTLWVATRGEPVPLRIAPKAGTASPDQFIDFTEYNKPVAIQAPKDAITDPTALR